MKLYFHGSFDGAAAFMANSDVKRYMRTVLDEYAAGKITASRAERCMEDLIGALEKVDSRQIESSRRLSGRLVHADVADGSLVECLGDETPHVVLEEFRRFVDAMPD